MMPERLTLTVDADLLRELDRLIDDGVYQSRSQAVRVALERILRRVDAPRVASDSADFDAETWLRGADELRNKVETTPLTDEFLQKAKAHGRAST